LAWIESHTDLGDHPKLAELCFILMIKKYEAVGHLHLLWHFAMKYAWRDGDLRRFTARAICEAAGWDKDHETFINALKDTGWIEKNTLRIHDWLDYSGKLVRDRLYNEERRKTALNDASSGAPRAKVNRYPTLPNPTLPNQHGGGVPPSLLQIESYCKERGDKVNPKKFFDFYEAKGWMIGKNKIKNWRAAVRTWEKDGNETKELIL